MYLCSVFTRLPTVQLIDAIDALFALKLVDQIDHIANSSQLEQRYSSLELVRHLRFVYFEIYDQRTLGMILSLSIFSR
jgi:hypothetical protein